MPLCGRQQCHGLGASVPATMIANMETPTPTLQNIVATFEVGVLDTPLETVVMRVPFANYNAQRFAAVIMKMTNPSATCLLFSSGKVVCTGARNESQCRKAAMSLVSLLRRFKIDTHFAKFQIQNVVAAVYCPFFVDLVMLQAELQGNCSYNVGVFPGLIYKTAMPNKIAILCFWTGKCVISGCRTRGQVLQVWTAFYLEHLVRCSTEQSSRQQPLTAPHDQKCAALARRLYKISGSTGASAEAFAATQAHGESLFKHMNSLRFLE
jgi:transcription initiation factor TFIID TATA-box-binding protein